MHLKSSILFSILISSIVCLAQSSAKNTQQVQRGKRWYVSARGDDSNAGTSLAGAFATLQKAAASVQPGDTVLIANGRYYSSQTGSGSALLKISTSGMPGKYITWKALPGHSPELRSTAWAAISVGASYQVFDGLNLVGANDSIVLLKALEQAKQKQPDPFYNTNGIAIDGRPLSPENKPHHILIQNCTISKFPGGGIAILEADYVTVQDCKVYNNAWYMRYGGSGITTLNNWAYDSLPGYHIIIQRNLVYNNKTMVPWEQIGKLSDGNGILLDVTDQAQGASNPNADSIVKKQSTGALSTKPKRPEWKGRALIANNISAYNGGSGIHTFRTKHVDIINNTTYWNGSVVGYEELFANRSEDVVILNNIIVPRPGGRVTSNHNNKNNVWDYNLYPQPQQVVSGPNDLVADPQFINIDDQLLLSSFKLKKSSVAVNSGTRQMAQPLDVSRKKRPAGTATDRGAHEQ